MSNGVNKIILIGRLGQDPETKYMPSGDCVCNISIATSESWKDKATGEKKEHTEWHRVVMFRRLAEIAGEYLKKGSQVYIEGKNKTRTYDKDGQTHYITEVEAREMQMLGGRGPTEGTAGASTGQQEPAPAPARQAAADNGGFEDKIPFSPIRGLIL